MHTTRSTILAVFGKPSVRIAIIFVLVVALVGAALYINRAEISRYAWYHHRVLETMAYETNPNDAILRLQMGEYYLNIPNEGAYDLGLAEFYFIEALRANPNIHLAWYHLGHLSFVRGDFASSIYRLNKQIELHGAHAVPGTYYVRALVYAYDQRYEKAIEDFSKFIEEVDPQSPWAHTDLAWVYLMQGDYQMAYDTTEKGLEYNPDNTWLLAMAGVALLNLDENEKAEAYLETAYEHSLKLTPDDWGKAYPANDPSIRAESLAFMQKTILDNLAVARGE